MAEDMKHTLKRMQELRDLLLLEGKLEDINKSLYLLLASKLAEGMKGTPALASIVHRLNDIDNAAWFYDPRQSGYWEEKSPSMVKDLDQALFRIKKEGFDSIEDRHHVLQAIKYSQIDDLRSAKDRDITFIHSILPAHGAVPDTAKQGWLERTFGFLLGATYTTEQHDLQTWRVRGSNEYIGDVMREAKARGYSRVLFDTDHKNFYKVMERFSQAGYKAERIGPPTPKENSAFASPKDYTIEAKIEHTPITRVPDPMPTFERILQIAPSPEAESSLDLGPGNYHTYGRAFIDCITEQLPSDVTVVEPKVEKEHNLVIFDQTVQIGPYTRSAKLYCSAGIRKIIVAITDEPQHERMLQLALSERMPVSLHIPGKHYVSYRASAGGELVGKEEF